MMRANQERADINAESDKTLMKDARTSRRCFLKTGLMTLACCCVPFPVQALAARLPDNRRLRFYNTHTRERLDVCYCEKGKYLPHAMSEINKILRDHRTGDVKPISPKLIDLLHTVAEQTGSASRIHIISGYRSPATNAKLRHKGRGVARKSFHMLGHAADIRIPSIPTSRLHRIVKKLKAGGVGYYAKSDFVHLDIGPVRHW